MDQKSPREITVLPFTEKDLLKWPGIWKGMAGKLIELFAEYGLRCMTTDEKQEGYNAMKSTKQVFAFAMGQSICMSKNIEEQGEIIARAEYARSENQYLIRYKNGNGSQQESWWHESAIQAISTVED